MKVLIHYGEIGLKGKNKHEYEKTLRNNIRKSAKYFELKLEKVIKDNSRTICIYEDNQDKQLIIKHLKTIFGIKNFAFIQEIKKDLDEIKKTIKLILEDFKNQGIKDVSFKTKRIDKNFKIKSPEINAKFGEIAKNLGIKVDYKNSKNIIYTEITYYQAFIYSKKIKGAEGLPIGTSGRVLCLLSGGIDSPVAAYQIMRRGCVVDFIHIHNLASNELAKNSKIIDTIKLLNNYQIKSTVYLIPYTNYEIATMGKLDSRIELIYFKHYILKLAEQIAINNNYDAILTGDNLAQVASQTIDNLNTSSNGITKMIFRPLLTYEKEEIITYAKKINSYELAIQEYKDCCSLVSKNPYTKTKISKLEYAKNKVDINKLIDESIKNMIQIKIEK